MSFLTRRYIHMVSIALLRYELGCPAMLRTVFEMCFEGTDQQDTPRSLASHGVGEDKPYVEERRPTTWHRRSMEQRACAKKQSVTGARCAFVFLHVLSKKISLHGNTLRCACVILTNMNTGMCVVSNLNPSRRFVQVTWLRGNGSCMYNVSMGKPPQCEISETPFPTLNRCLRTANICDNI